jgi:hypothetical protein
VNGGIDKEARFLADKFVDDHLNIIFKHDDTMVKPFICSFCRHTGDEDYERENGLLSQWRGYGGATGDGRFALVFDTARLDALLAQEWESYYWLALDLVPVVYQEEAGLLEKYFKGLTARAGEILAAELRGNIDISAEFIAKFLNAATSIKHRGFREEREVRITAMPHSRVMMETHAKPEDFQGVPPFKQLHVAPGSKTHIALFSSFEADLPIKRVIVGPSKNQPQQVEFARSLVVDKVPIHVSETPFIG